MSIFAIGDSHSIFYHNSEKIIELWFGMSNIPVTIFKLLINGLDIYKVGKILKKQEKYNIKANDKVMFCYGYNDIQKNIYKYAKENYEIELNNLLTKYIDLILIYKSKYNIIPIIQNIYPNPLIKSKNVNGSEEIRIIYTKYANELLYKLCKKNEIKFFDIYEKITDNNGYIKKEYTKDGIHLDYNNKKLQSEIINDLIDL